MEPDVASTPQERAMRHVASLCSGPPVDPDLQVTLNFHPDRMVGDRPILVALAEDGAYHSQYVTGTSNGGAHGPPRRRPMAMGEPDLRRRV